MFSLMSGSDQDKLKQSKTGSNIYWIDQLNTKNRHRQSSKSKVQFDKQTITSHRTKGLSQIEQSKSGRYENQSWENTGKVTVK